MIPHHSEGSIVQLLEDFVILVEFVVVKVCGNLRPLGFLVLGTSIVGIDPYFGWP